MEKIFPQIVRFCSASSTVRSFKSCHNKPKYMYYYGTLLRIQISTATEMFKKKKKELQAKTKLVKDARSVGLTDTSTECGLSFWRWPMILMLLCRKMPVNAFCISHDP